MEVILPWFEVITPWHWLGLALLLLGIEMMLATYDLLWLSASAFLTAAWSALPLPAGMSSWQVECIVFGVVGIILVVLGRTVFSGFREAVSDRPNLNKRGNSMVGKSAVAVTGFSGGEGRVRYGDSTWLASADPELLIPENTEVRIIDVQGTVLRVSV